MPSANDRAHALLGQLIATTYQPHLSTQLFNFYRQPPSLLPDKPAHLNQSTHPIDNTNTIKHNGRLPRWQL
jgi:hypothetical protein